MRLDQAIHAGNAPMEFVLWRVEMMAVDKVEIIGDADEARRQLLIEAGGRKLQRFRADEEMVLGREPAPQLLAHIEQGEMRSERLVETESIEIDVELLDVDRA